LSDDGNCLYAGYRGYLGIWQLDPAKIAVELAGERILLPAPEDSVNTIWLAENNGCSLVVYAEITDAAGVLSIVKLDATNPAARPVTLYIDLFDVPGHNLAARVGRIPPPLALTLDFDGNLYRWDLDANSLTAAVEVGDMAMFGAANLAGTHYAWLATDYRTLHLVNFSAGTDRVVASLGDGVYVSHLKLTHEADVILGVDPKDAPGTVSAWTVETGERLDLGPYRECIRTQPDLVQLSRDGTALVIGCDTGLDIWRVVAGGE
jgi:hypothetical protein